MREIDELIVHCSDSEFGDAETIDGWHTRPKMPLEIAEKIKRKELPAKEAHKYGRGWSDIGYHYVVLNGRRKARGRYRTEDDGRIETGRPLEIPGAHCRGHNKRSVGVCLIGKHHFTAKQLLQAIPELVRELGLNAPKIVIKGHYEYDKGKTCPNIDMELIRREHIL